MEFRQYKLDGPGWTKLTGQHSRLAPGAKVIWTEIVGFETSDASTLADLLSIEADLLEYSVTANASFIATDSDALLQLGTRTARLVGSEIRYASLLVIVNARGITTVESGDSGIGVTVRKQWSGGGFGNRKENPWLVLAELLDTFADSYLPLVEGIEDRILAVEEHLFEAPLPLEQLSTLFHMRKQTALVQRVLDPVSKLLARINQYTQQTEDSEPTDFRAAQDGLQRLESKVDGLWQAVTSAVEMNNLMEQQRQGNANRKLAAWAAIVAVPTALSGIFGMNFARMPGIDTDHGYLVALAAMGIACTGLFLRFRKIGWL